MKAKYIVIIFSVLVVAAVSLLIFQQVNNKKTEDELRQQLIDESISIVKKDYNKDDVTYKFIEENPKDVFKIIVSRKNDDHILRIYLVNIKYKTFTYADPNDSPPVDTGV